MKNLLLILLLSVISCGKLPEFKLKSSKERQNVSAYYSSNLRVNVYYEEGAEPYTDNVLTLKLWDVFQKNLSSLFEGRSTKVTVPKTLPEMAKMSAMNKSTWTLEEVMNLADSYKLMSATNTVDFKILFLNGRFVENPNTLGFHISNTKVMAIFKDVIRGSGTGAIPKYVEQATLIHEMGHAVGLVNNGVSMINPHQDSAHGAHCSNPDCVMYYSNEGAASMMKFAEKAFQNLSINMFDQHCLDDARNFKK